MQFRISDAPLASLATEALVVPVFADKELRDVAQAADADVGGAIAEALAAGEIAGKPNEFVLIHATGKSYKRIFVVGLGDRAKFDLAALAKYAGTAVRTLGKRNVKDITIALPAEAAQDAKRAASFVVEGAIAATFDVTAYRTTPDKPVVTESVAVHTGTLDRAALEAGVARGEILGTAVNLARTLALTPANDMTPSDMAEAAEKVASDYGLAYHALDEEQMYDKKMGSLLCVAKGTSEPAQMIVLEYAGDPSSTEKLALVGKGLTFDSGGISLKPADKMEEMKYDMSGGAGVIAAMAAIAQLKPKLNVIGIVPSSENLPGPDAVKPGDVVTAMNGTTIEVINTDAEGRLILADALCYAKELGATKIVDCATLTGAIVVALGHAATGAMTNDDAMLATFLPVANASGERYWHMPLFEDYSTIVKSEIADLRNSAGRPGGSCTAAAFLKTFVGETPWIHLDIAGTAYLDNETSSMAKGPQGVPVRALVAFAESLATAPR
jgi:leucyl aminopeptidase